METIDGITLIYIIMLFIYIVKLLFKNTGNKKHRYAKVNLKTVQYKQNALNPLKKV